MEHNKSNSPFKNNEVFHPLTQSIHKLFILQYGPKNPGYGASVTIETKQDQILRKLIGKERKKGKRGNVFLFISNSSSFTIFYTVNSEVTVVDMN